MRSRAGIWVVPPVTGTARPRDGLTEVTGDGWLRPLLSTDEASGAVAIVAYPWEISLARQAPTAQRSTWSWVRCAASRQSETEHR
jgi:hypothetical protein